MSHCEDQIKWIEHPERNDGNPWQGGFVYILYNNENEVIYVGQTNSIDSRLKTHYSQKKDAIYCKYFKVKSEEMSDWEAFFILKYLPKYNKTLPKNNSYYTLEGYQSVDQRFYSKKIEVLRLCEGLKTFRGYYHERDLMAVSCLLDSEEDV